MPDPESNKGRSRAGFVPCVIRRVGVSLGMNGDVFTTWQRPGIGKPRSHSQNKLLCRPNQTNTCISTADFYWIFQKQKEVQKLLCLCLGIDWSNFSTSPGIHQVTLTYISLPRRLPSINHTQLPRPSSAPAFLKSLANNVYFVNK